MVWLSAGSAAAVSPDRQCCLHSSQYIINRLAALAHEFRADQPGDKISFEGEDVFRAGAMQSLAENRGHGPGQGLNLMPQADPKAGMIVFVDPQVDADGVGAFFIFAHVFEVEGLARLGSAMARAVGIMHQQPAAFAFRELFEKVNDVVKGGGHGDWQQNGNYRWGRIGLHANAIRRAPGDTVGIFGRWDRAGLLSVSRFFPSGFSCGCGVWVIIDQGCATAA